MRKQILKIFLTITLVLLGNEPALAAPSIDLINGSFMHGEKIIISGSGFGTKSASTPVVWDQFKTGNNGDPPQGWSLTSDNDAGDKPQLSNSVVRYPAAPFSAKFHFLRGASSYGEDIIWRENLPVTGTRRYADYWVWFQMPIQSAIAPDSLQHQFKLVRMTSAPGDVANKPAMYTAAWRHSPGNRNTYQSISADSTHTYTNGFYWTANFVDGAWNHVRIAFDTGTPGNLDGTVRVWLNNQLAMENSAVNFIGAEFAPSTPFFNNFQVGWYLGNTALSTTETTIYYGEVYYDDSWNRVEICDSLAYSSCSHSEIQPFNSWADNSLTVTVNKGSFSDGQAYLFVIDENGNPSEGYPITFASSSDAIAPATPSGLSVL